MLPARQLQTGTLSGAAADTLLQCGGLTTASAWHGERAPMCCSKFVALSITARLVPGFGHRSDRIANADSSVAKSA